MSEDSSTSSFTAAAVEAWKLTAAVPDVQFCSWLSDDTMMARTSQKDVALGIVRSTLHTFGRSSASGEWQTAGFPVELSADTTLVVPSPSGALLARAVTVTASDGPGKGAGREGLFPAPVDLAPALGTHTRIDVTDRSGSQVASITLPSIVYADGWFEGCKWSPDETSIVIVAEAPRRADAPRGGFFAPDKNSADGTLYEYAADWGEAKVGMRRSVLLLLDLTTNTATELAKESVDISLGTPIWGPGGSSIVCTGTMQSSQASLGYGVTGCVQRKTSLFAVSPYTPEAAAVELLGQALPTARLPQLSEDGKCVRFVATVEDPSELYTHGTCSALCAMDATAIQTMLESAGTPKPLPVTILVHTVEEVVANGVFPGLWGGTGAGLNWFDLADSGLLINSVAFGVETVWHLPAGAPPGSTPQAVATQARVMCAQPCEDGELIMLLQSPTRRPTLASATVSSLLSMNSPQSPVDDRSSIFAKFWGDVDSCGWHGCRWSQRTLEPWTRISSTNTCGEVVHYVSVLPGEDGHRSASNSPAVIFPHGGPHSVTTTGFNAAAAFFVQLGFSCHLVNYRGSLSWGQGSIKALKGRCGEIDVADCAQVAEDVVSRGVAAADRLFFLGGSHSGFIGAHLAGQYPTLFNAYSLRNPVTNIAAMAAATDIADWCLEELGLPGASEFPAQLGLNAEGAKSAMATMFAASPHAYVHSVVRPVLQCIGDSDRRVPPFQARQYHAALLERGVDARLLVYPGQGHPISKPDMEGDVYVNTARWFALYDSSSDYTISAMTISKL
jgi:acylaminoacyl-peptidase